MVDAFVEMFEMEIVEKKGTSCRRLNRTASVEMCDIQCDLQLRNVRPIFQNGLVATLFYITEFMLPKRRF